MLDRTVTPKEKPPEEHKMSAGRRHRISGAEVRRRSAPARHRSACVGVRARQPGKNALTDEERCDARRLISQQKRKLIERAFGWGKLDRPLRQTKLRGLNRVEWLYRLIMAAYDLVRMRSLIPIEAMAS